MQPRFVAVVLLLGCAAPDPVEVEIGVVERRDLVQVVTAKGRIAPKRYVEVVAERVGQVTEIHVKEGDTVERGQLLVRLEVAKTATLRAGEAELQALQSEYRSFIAAIEAGKAAEAAQQASLEKSQLELDRSQKELERAVLLDKDGLISRNDFDSRKAAHRASEVAVKEAQASLEQTRTDRKLLNVKRDDALGRIKQGETQRRRMESVLRRFPVISPVAGVITAIQIEAGADVEREDGETQATPLMTIADVAQVTAVFDGTRLALGQGLVVNVEGSTIAGEVSEVAGGSATVTLAKPPQPLTFGADCTVQIERTGEPGALAVPSGAIIERGDSAVLSNKLTGIFVVEEERVTFQPVEIGVLSEGWREITKGLQEGQKIVINPGTVNLEPGARVIAASQN